MKSIVSCGVLVFRRDPELQFLLLKHPDRWDLPKGHVDPGETELQCALRELDEETGISAAAVRVEPNFRFENRYQIQLKRYGKDPVEKTLAVYLGWLLQDQPIRLTEHDGYRWFPWSPPHKIQVKTIDPLLRSVQDHFQEIEVR